MTFLQISAEIVRTFFGIPYKHIFLQKTDSSPQKNVEDVSPFISRLLVEKCDAVRETRLREINERNRRAHSRHKFTN